MMYDVYCNSGKVFDFISMERGIKMAVSYKRLCHLLLDRNMKKKDLEEQAGISRYAMNKLNHDEDVSTEILGKICKTLNCTIDEIYVGKILLPVRFKGQSIL